MDTGNILPHNDVDKFHQYLASIKPAEFPVVVPPRIYVSHFDETADAMVAGGYLSLLRPCIPSGKVPGELTGGRWEAMSNWPNRTPAEADIAAWRLWPDAGVCLVTGTVAAIDIDIKIGSEETGQEADRGRALVVAIKRLTSEALGVPVDRLPMRWRDNSTSCMVLMKLSAPLGKKQLPLIDAATGRKFAIEFLAKGQQVVIAGVHESGARVQSSLPNVPLDELPILESAKRDALFSAIAEAAGQLGFNPGSFATSATREHKPPYVPSVAVLREVMARRAEWVPSVLPCSPSADREWRISSAELDRDLEEALVIFPDGIRDHGAERGHTPASLIREFGSIDDTGEISFGGSPAYGREGQANFAVVAEPDAAVRRPTEAEAMTWLCRKLAGDQFPAFSADATWSACQPLLARAVGLDWCDLAVARWFDHTAGEEPSSWSADKLKSAANYLAALRAVDPGAFDRIVFARDLKGCTVDLEDLARDHRAAVASGRISAAAPSAVLADDSPEPFDIFAQDDPAELSTLPPNCLPEMLLRWVRSESRRKGAPESFAALAAIAVASSAIGASLRIQPKALDTGFVQFASLWAAIVAEPGRGKSPIISAAEKPLRDLDAEWYAAGKDRHDRWSAAMQAHRKKPKENPDPGPEPVIRRIVVDDITLEQQVRVHSQNARGLIRCPDELMGLFGSLGQYKKGSEGDRSQALRLFEGRPIAVDRVGGGSIRADKALMGVLAGTQPQKLAEIARNLGADGMLQRFIFVIDDGVEREAADEEPDREAVGAYMRAIRTLATTDFPYATPLRMSPEAQQVFRDASAAIGRLRHVPGTSPAWRGHLDKWGLFLPRLTLTFHALEHAFGLEGSDLNSEISVETVGRAVNFARFLLRHSLRLYQMFFAPDVAADDARGAAGYLLTKPDLLTFTCRTISDARKDLRDRRRLFAAMAELETANWVAVDKRDQDGPAAWRVNPKIHQRFEAQAGREMAERAGKRKAIVAAGEARKWVNSDKLSEGDGHAS
ncbi:DUF3987 domain-containing protein [Mesorhizobium sp. B3-1-3]|uniref:DUF3987 domain-containing protein n=1 Tax=unclassified Mesorhizobium TaxID=325217 RepID=UPI0011292C97|nr:MULTISPECIES: DUF3987 domain-containing protein [unclassified Mesorhizobium]TPI64276.1 DUF3987 domain-containing protein [Mesorhizobium sp. B3-1-8]TPI70244.1 DUF3987 domain-containing protein [Mesorhizobium sp. B3-1-3]